MHRRLDVVTTTVTNFYMLDLAGSESFDYDDGLSGRGINTGLLALGRVLMSLSDKRGHVPYRDSLITQLLQSVLGGSRNCTACMLCCLSPNAGHATETKCSLGYALRCKALEEGEIAAANGSQHAATAVAVRGAQQHGSPGVHSVAQNGSPSRELPARS